MMIKMMFLVHRRSDLDSEAFRKYWRETHSRFARNIPGLRKYIQHHALPNLDGSPPPYDGIAELWWDDQEAMENAFASLEGQAVLADLKNFLGPEKRAVFRVDQVKVV
jgi:uncharacterized protein (TIGR02118 family)